VKSHPY